MVLITNELGFYNHYLKHTDGDIPAEEDSPIWYYFFGSDRDGMLVSHSYLWEFIKEHMETM
jgi:hypothetical protein